MDDLDRRLLAMVAAHDSVTADHVQRYLPLDADVAAGRFESLCADRLLRRERLAWSLEPLFRATGAGLAAIGSRLTPPGSELNDIRRQLAVAMVWVAAWDGFFGDLSRVLSRRELEGLDRAAEASATPGAGFGVKLDGRVVSPDLALVTSRGQRIGVHLLMWPHRSWDPALLLAAYDHQRVVDAVLVLVQSRPAVDELEATAERLGVGKWLYVRELVTGGRELASG